MIKEIKFFLQQKRMTAKFSNINHEYMRIFLKDVRLYSCTGPVTDLVFTITMLSIIWLAGVTEKGLTPGSVVSLFMYLQYVLGPVTGIMGFVISIQHMLWFVGNEYSKSSL
ncbi:hypothetical protein KJ693_11645 [bacterium]|nr:hypothetical protein [bacterium]MBU1600029.1 hypothetical protein [bacterium]MBU1615944.1 hypothetical protein [bacterium]